MNAASNSRELQASTRIMFNTRVISCIQDGHAGPCKLPNVNMKAAKWWRSVLVWYACDENYNDAMTKMAMMRIKMLMLLMSMLMMIPSGPEGRSPQPLYP